MDGTHELPVSWAEIIWAAVSVGKAQLQDLTLYGVFSAFEMAYRIAMMYANLRENPSGYICRSSAYNGLDPSEKGAISYFVGLTMSKLLVGRLLSVPWLMHLDVYRLLLAPILLADSKPDMVGLTVAGQWVVVEAKGRTNRFVASVLAAAKDQTQQLTTIQGVAPTLRVASLSSFDNGILHVAIDDPNEERARLADLPLTPELILENYYRPFKARLEEPLEVAQERVRGESFRVAHLPDVDMWIGLGEKARHPNSTIEQAIPPYSEGREFVGSDGILIRLGPAWSNENMKLQPQERVRA
ncbi:MAG: hypothetical protein ACRD72_12650 [Candidatus Angelobacter sp.]